MTDQETPSIREVLEKAVEEPKAPAHADSDAPASKSTEKTSSSPAPEGNGKAEESLESINPRLREKIEARLAKLDPEERAEVLKDLRDYDRGFHRSMKQVSEFRKFTEDLAKKFPGITAAELEEAVASKRAPKSSAPTKVDATMSEEDIDALIEKATDPKAREELRKSKAVLHREIEKRLDAKLKPLQDELDRLKQSSTATRASDLDRQIDALEDVEGFPSSFIEQYRDDIKKHALKWNLPVTEVMTKIVPYSELVEAFANRTTTTTKTKSSHRAPSAPNVSAPAKAVDTEKFREKRGGWNVKDALASLAKHR